MTLLELRGTTRSMTRMALMVATIVVAVLGSATIVGAQATRGFVTFNGGYQGASTDFSDNIVFTKFLEEGDLDASYDGLGGRPLYDVGGGIRIWRSLAVGVAASVFSKGVDAGVTARIPHPFFFNRDRQISGSQLDLRREETAVHIHAIWVVPVNETVEIMVYGGPTFFSIKQDLVRDVLFTEAYPYNTATYTGTTTGMESKSKVGFNVGADVAFYFTGHVGIGMMARFSRATIDLSSQDGGAVAVETGGFHAGGGLRLRF